MTDDAEAYCDKLKEDKKTLENIRRRSCMHVNVTIIIIIIYTLLFVVYV